MVLVEHLPGFVNRRHYIAPVVWDQEIRFHRDGVEALDDGGGDILGSHAGECRSGDRALVDREEAADYGRFGDVRLVEDEDLGDGDRIDLGEDFAHGSDLAVGIRIRGIDDMNVEVGVCGFVQC